MTRVIVFGLDAASPMLIDGWLDELPGFRRIVKEGAWGTLKSTNPPYTSPAWTCMATGLNPGKVGIFGLRQRRRGTYQWDPVTSAHRRVQTIWEIIGDQGLESIVFNVPDTFPPSSLRGVMVSGRPAPVGTRSSITYPEELRREIEDVVGEYPISPPTDFDETSRRRELAAWKDVLDRQQLALEHLMTTRSWSLCFSVSMAVDGVSHHFWPYIDAQHPWFNPSVPADLKQGLKRVYQLEDRRLQRVIENLTEDDILLVVSDHGSTPCRGQISVNRWLIDHGYLRLKGELETGVRQRLLGPLASLTFHIYETSNLFRRLLRPFRRFGLRNTLVDAKFVDKSQGRIPLSMLPIDWKKSEAYFVGENRLYLNVQGREPEGVVPAGKPYEDKREELRRTLLEAKVPGSNEPLFSRVQTRDELYSGPLIEQAPDLVLTSNRKDWVLGSAVGKQLIEPPIIGGKHHPDGLFMAWGPQVKCGYRGEASIYDIAPTILHALEIPISTSMDGKVLTNWFEGDSEIARRPVRAKTYNVRLADDYSWKEEDKDIVEDHLRNLGYLE